VTEHFSGEWPSVRRRECGKHKNQRGGATAQ
jgi:hypothetical protein